MEQDDIRPEYDFTKMKGVRGKYFHRMWADHGLRHLRPDLAKAFPDDESVNRALEMLIEVARSQGRGRQVA